MGSTIIFSTHNMSSVEELCDHIALINNGKTILHGSMQDIRDQYKADTYQLNFRGDPKTVSGALHGLVQLTEEPTTGETRKMFITRQNGVSTREILEKINPLVDISSFSEVVPSMNDIFIRVVEQSKQK